LIRERCLISRWKSGNLEKAKCISCNGCFETGLEGFGVTCKIEKKLKEKQGETCNVLSNGLLFCSARSPGGSFSQENRSPQRTPKYAYLARVRIRELVVKPGLLRIHLGVFGKGVQGENPFAKGFSPWVSAF
jgi:hypothetical protein